MASDYKPILVEDSQELLPSNDDIALIRAIYRNRGYIKQILNATFVQDSGLHYSDQTIMSAIETTWRCASKRVGRKYDPPPISNPNEADADR